MKKLILCLTVVCGSSAFSTTIQPIYAADQPVVTALSMEFEAKQFQSIAEHQCQTSSLESKKFELESYRAILERSLKLEMDGDISKFQLLTDKYNVVRVESELKILTFDIESTRLNVEYFKQRILEQGNPTQELRRTVALAHKQYLESQLKRYEESEKAGQEAITYNKIRMKAANILREKKLISLTTLDKLEQELRAAEDQVRSARFRLEGLKQALIGLNHSLRVL